MATLEEQIKSIEDEVQRTPKIAMVSSAFRSRSRGSEPEGFRTVW